LRKLFVTFLFLMLAMSAIWSYRVRAAGEAAELRPAANETFVLPAGTAIDALVRNGIGRDAKAGDRITAFVSNPVSSDHSVVIPVEAQLQGNLEQISIAHHRAEVRIRFSALLIHGQRFDIHARQVSVRMPIVTDIDELSAALETLMATSLGTSIGAASGDRRLVERGLLEGTKIVDATGISIPVTVTLTRNLEVKRS
jgi:hypothetical protein